MMTKLAYIFTLMVLLAMGGAPAMAQFANFRLELPAGVNFGSQVISPNPENPDEQLIWIEIVAYENMTILVDISNENNIWKQDRPVFLLNNGSSDFAGAKNIGLGAQSIQLDQSGLLIQNKLPKTMNVKAWLGIPVQPGLIAKIEYP